MIYDLTLLDEIHKLTAKGVSLSFYNCSEDHLLHELPYVAESLEDVVIRVYKDSTKEDVLKQINEAKRNVIHLLNTFEVEELTETDMTEYSDIYKYLYKYSNFDKTDIPKLSVMLRK